MRLMTVRTPKRWGDASSIPAGVHCRHQSARRRTEVQRLRSVAQGRVNAVGTSLGVLRHHAPREPTHTSVSLEWRADARTGIRGATCNSRGAGTGIATARDPSTRGNTNLVKYAVRTEAHCKHNCGVHEAGGRRVETRLTRANWRSGGTV